jgi:hypothetical protein
LRTDDGLLIRPDREEVELKFHRPDLFFMPLHAAGGRARPPKKWMYSARQPRRMKFNLVARPDDQPISGLNGTSFQEHGAQRIGEITMDTQSKRLHRGLRPVIISAIVAIGATAGILFNDFGPSSAPQDSRTARMVTAAAISRAGAIEIPSKPAAV